MTNPPYKYWLEKPIKQKKSLTKICKGLSKKAATYSPTSVVPSAQMGLTSLFGMVRGEPHCYNHLKSLAVI